MYSHINFIFVLFKSLENMPNVVLNKLEALNAA